MCHLVHAVSLLLALLLDGALTTTGGFGKKAQLHRASLSAVRLDAAAWAARQLPPTTLQKAAGLQRTRVLLVAAAERPLNSLAEAIRR